MSRLKVHATPSIALVGRKNVGKSSLFNRLTETRQAIVSDIPGTTRDVGVGYCSWRGKMLTLLDTGGLDVIKTDIIEMNVRKQAIRAAEKSHLVLFVVDAETGPVSTDIILAKQLRKLEAPAILVVNKADSPKKRKEFEYEWKKLGFGDPVIVSAATGSGTGDLLDRILEELQTLDLPLDAVEPELVLSLIGRPNVGKSSTLNAMIGEERVIVSEVAHTTREPQDTILFYDDMPILVRDTAGIRKRARVGRGLEKIGVSKSIRALKESDVVFLVLDVMEEVGIQDRHLAGMAAESGKAVAIVLNKWDKVPNKTTHSSATYEDYFRAQFPFLAWAPMIFTSAKTGQRMKSLLDLAVKLKKNREREIDIEDLDAFVEDVVKPFIAERKPKKMKDKRGGKKRHPMIFGIRQTRTAPPVFTVIAKNVDTLNRSYLRFIENRLRERFDLEGVPVKIISRPLENKAR